MGRFALPTDVFVHVHKHPPLFVLLVCHPILFPPDKPLPCLQLYAWGWGRYGNLGDGEKADR